MLTQLYGKLELVIGLSGWSHQFHLSQASFEQCEHCIASKLVNIHVLLFRNRCKHPSSHVSLAEFVTHLDYKDDDINISFFIHQFVPSVAASLPAFVYANSKSTIHVVQLSSGVSSLQIDQYCHAARMSPLILSRDKDKPVTWPSTLSLTCLGTSVCCLCACHQAGGQYKS